MKLEGLPFTPVDWSTVPVTRHAGQAGEALWRTLQAGAERVRLVESRPATWPTTGAGAATSCWGSRASS